MARRSMSASAALCVCAALAATANPGPALAYPASYFTTITSGMPPGECSRIALKALRLSGEADAAAQPWGASGTIPTTRGYIVCVAIPKAGSCGGAGTTAVIVAAGDDADGFHNKIASNFHPSTPFDCN